MQSSPAAARPPSRPSILTGHAYPPGVFFICTKRGRFSTAFCSARVRIQSGAFLFNSKLSCRAARGSTTDESSGLLRACGTPAILPQSIRTFRCLTAGLRSASVVAGQAPPALNNVLILWGYQMCRHRVK